MSGNGINVKNEGAVTFDGTRFSGETLPVAYGGTNTTSFGHTDGIVTYDGTSLRNYLGPKILSGGYYTNNKQPLFMVTPLVSIADITGNGFLYTIPFGHSELDHGSNYNNSTYIFTAPTAGRYFLQSKIQINKAGDSTSHYLYINVVRSSGTRVILTSDPLTADNCSITASGIVEMDENDTAQVRYEATGGSDNTQVSILGNTTSYYTYFEGYLIG